MALNTHSIDLELSSSQSLSITDGSQTGLEPAGDLSIEGWIKVEQLPSTATTGFVVVSKDGGGSNRQYNINIGTSDTINFRVWDTANTKVDLKTDAAFLVADDVGEWVHFACTYDISGPAMVCYKNGSAVASTVTGSTNGTNKNGTAAFSIGSVNTTSSFVDGLMDEVRFWNDLRTASEITNNKDDHIDPSTAGLVGYWRLNNSLLDETSNDNDLTNNNSAVFSVDTPFAGTASGPANVKSWNGVALADIKSINGLAIGDIKSINSLA